MTEDVSNLLHPKPPRHYDLTPTSSNSSPPDSPSAQPSESSRLEVESDRNVAMNRSILNLTSSTLFGIYTPSASGYGSKVEESLTPWGNGSQTPGRGSLEDTRSPVIGAYARPKELQRKLSHQQSYQHHSKFWTTLVPIGERIILLFCFGVAYGVIISHLHDSQQVAPVQLEGVRHSSWKYLVGWGGVGIILGGLLPWVDVLWEEVSGNSKDVFASQHKAEDLRRPSTAGGDEEERPSSRSGSGLGADWNPVVRSIGAFIGIAFAIRRLPWQSTLQVSLTLALVNPVLWYLVDRSKPGFLLSMLVGLTGTAIAFGVNPEIVPSPAAPSPRAGSMNILRFHGMHDGLMSNESIGVGTWIASVLFCSSVCFGNIGRRLALGVPSRRPSLTSHS